MQSTYPICRALPPPVAESSPLPVLTSLFLPGDDCFQPRHFRGWLFLKRPIFFLAAKLLRTNDEVSTFRRVPNDAVPFVSGCSCIRLRRAK